jgi:hypothetical protein
MPAKPAPRTRIFSPATLRLLLQFQHGKSLALQLDDQTALQIFGRDEALLLDPFGYQAVEGAEAIGAG